MDHWQDFTPGTKSSGRQPGSPAAATGVQSGERTRILSLIDFPIDRDAPRNPPVRDISKDGRYLSRDADLPEATGVEAR
jgi:hypothetical protein